MTVFADASAAVKRYVDEPGSEVVGPLDDLVLSALTRVEVPSAIWRKEREGHVTVEQARAVLDAFEYDWHGTSERDPVFGVIATGPGLLTRAAELVGRHDVRAGDAVQLASALSARRADPETTTFLCFDLRLRAAAAGEGFTLLPAEL